jgi:hypothetical protein
VLANSDENILVFNAGYRFQELIVYQFKLEKIGLLSSAIRAKLALWYLTIARTDVLGLRYHVPLDPDDISNVNAHRHGFFLSLCLHPLRRRDFKNLVTVTWPLVFINTFAYNSESIFVGMAPGFDESILKSVNCHTIWRLFFHANKDKSEVILHIGPCGIDVHCGLPVVFVCDYRPFKAPKASILTGFQVQNYAPTPFVKPGLAREL